jgi:hypothetical protein
MKRIVTILLVAGALIMAGCGSTPGSDQIESSVKGTAYLEFPTPQANLTLVVGRFQIRRTDGAVVASHRFEFGWFSNKHPDTLRGTFALKVDSAPGAYLLVVGTNCERRIAIKSGAATNVDITCSIS